MLRVLDIFSGIGGIALGLERAGMRTVAFCEVDEKCRRVLRHHWPTVPIYEDVRDLGAARLEADGIACDVLAGGFPCQPFSTAARGRNNQTDLWPEQRRLADELRPDWVIGENVPGLGMRGVDRVCADLESIGYTAWAIRMDTAPPGRQLGRERFIFLAHANGDGEPRRPVDAEVAGISEVPRRRWPDDPAPMGMDDGLPNRMDRLRMLGNAVSPWASEVIGRAIMNAEARMN